MARSGRGFFGSTEAGARKIKEQINASLGMKAPAPKKKVTKKKKR